ncbi:ankyrin repeat domain-containing protein [Candidatus Babeliales bacterium]|nr:ankyrin repeat domain-containing protein [Candidatus Babeliales bacterium]
MKPKNIIFTFLLALLSLSILNLSAAESIEYSDEAGQKLLRYTRHGNIDGVEKSLKENNVNINIQNENGNTALHLATITEKGCHEIVSKLLEYKADPNMKNNDGNTPLHLAAKNGQIVTLNLLLAKRADTIIQNNDKKTPLDLASAKGHNFSVKILEAATTVDFKPLKSE